MELRVLNYFLMVAREENITKAAQLLHVTQPTLSRQLIQLEEELGVQLFHRGKHCITLTEDGMLLRRRALEITSLSEKTIAEFKDKTEMPSGEIFIGCGETKSMEILAENIRRFHKMYPLTQFHIYSATADDVKERIEKGLLDIGLLTEPVDISKYEFIRMPCKERWGVLVNPDSVLYEKESVSPADLSGIPLIMVQRNSVKDELASWFGEVYEQLEVAATYNLILNAASMVKEDVGTAICFDLGMTYGKLRFIPFAPKLETGSVLVWKKNQAHTDTLRLFLQFIKNAL